MNHPVAGSLSLAIDERYKALLHTIQQLPPKGSRPLTVSARVSGWVTSRATSALKGLPGVRIEEEAVHITAARLPRMPLNGGPAQARPEEGRVGKAWDSTGRSRGAP